LLPDAAGGAAKPSPDERLLSADPRIVAKDNSAIKGVNGIPLLMAVQEALGGRQRLAGLRDWKRISKETWLPGNGTTESLVEFLAPSFFREEAKGGNVTITYTNGQLGWNWSSTRRVLREMGVVSAAGASLGHVHTLLLSGEMPGRIIKAVEPDVLRFSDQHRHSYDLRIDSTTHRPFELSWNTPDGAVLEEQYSDWRKVGGVLWWHHMTRARDGQVFLKVDVKSWKVNTGLTESELSKVPPYDSRQPPGKK